VSILSSSTSSSLPPWNCRDFGGRAPTASPNHEHDVSLLHIPDKDTRSIDCLAASGKSVPGPMHRSLHRSLLPSLHRTLIRVFVAVTQNQIERLYSRFTSLDRGDCGTLSREDFLRIPELAINPLGDRIVNAFFEESSSDRVNFLQFMQVLAHFRPIKKHSQNILNSREEKLRCKYRRCELS
jgi:hypothetical protein